MEADKESPVDMVILDAAAAKELYNFPRKRGTKACFRCKNRKVKCDVRISPHLLRLHDTNHSLC